MFEVSIAVSEVEFRGLTITGGLADYGGGLFNYSATLTLADSTLSGNSATYRRRHLQLRAR